MLTSKLESRGWVIEFTPRLTDAEWAELADKGFWDAIWVERREWVSVDEHDADGTVIGKNEGWVRYGSYDLGKALELLRKIRLTGGVALTITEVRTKSEREIAEQENRGVRSDGRGRNLGAFTRRISKGL